MAQFNIFAELFSPSSLPGAIVNQFGGDIASWAWTELGTLLTGGEPPDTTQTSLNNLLAGVTQMEQSISALNSLLGWDTSSQEADTCEAQLTAYYQEFLTGVDWPTFWQDVTGIGTPGTNSAPNYSASVPYNAMTLNNLLTVQNVNGVGGMIQQAITNQLSQCQYSPAGGSYLAPWQVTQNVINFMTETMLIQQQAIVVLAAAYGYAQNQGWTSQCALIQGYVNDIAGYLQQQLTIYQETMPVWLQVLASQSNVHGVGGATIGWAPVYQPPSNPADPPSYTPPPTPLGFSCAIGYPNYNPGLYAAATAYGGQAKLGACPDTGTAASKWDKQYGFPVCNPSPCTQPSPAAPTNVNFIGLTDSGNFSPSMYWNLFPVVGSNGFWLQCASGTDSDKMSLEPTWSPPDANGTLSALTLGNPPQGAEVWICPAYTAPPSPTFPGWNDIVYIYASKPGSSPVNQWAFSPPFQGCAYWYPDLIGGISEPYYVNTDPPAGCPTLGLMVVGGAGTGGPQQFNISIAPVEANPQGTSVNQNVSGPPPMNAPWMPALSSISVTSVAPNSTTPNVVLSGTNLEAATVNSLGSMINFKVTAATSTTMTVTITASNAGPGPYDISVTTASGVSNSVVLYVTPYIQTMALVGLPVPGNSVPVILTGYGLGGANNDSFQFSESYVSVQAVAADSETEVAATLAITGSATPGTVQVSLALGGNTSNQVSFVIDNLTSMTPTSGMAGQTVPVTLSGVNLTGATITVTGGITVGTPTASSETSITAPFTIPSAASGPQQVTVNIPAGGSNPLTFTVTPYLASVTVSEGVAWGAPGQSVAVTITGSGLSGVTQTGGNLDAGLNIQVSGVTVVNDGEVQANFTVSQNASLGPVSVHLTVPSGNGKVTSNPVQFFVASTQPSF